MELNTTRLITSVLIIGLGVLYYRYPEKSLKVLNFMKRDYEPSAFRVKWFKYGGIFVSVLGVYYILVMFDVLPMIIYPYDWN